MKILGIDIGGSGIKGAIIDTESGEQITERHRIKTPQPATPEAVGETILKIVEFFDYSGPIGCGFPSLISHGIVKTAANIDKSWISVNAEKLFSKITKKEVFVVNDADAAGIGEANFGAAKDTKGVVFLITVGTGLGTAIITDNQLLPNTELGHIVLPNGKKAEHFCSDFIRSQEDLSWKKWAFRFSEYLDYLTFLFSPDVFVIGGGASKKFEKYQKYLPKQTKIVPATLKNMAGIIGAAIYAEKHYNN